MTITLVLRRTPRNKPYLQRNAEKRLRKKAPEYIPGPQPAKYSFFTFVLPEMVLPFF